MPQPRTVRRRQPARALIALGLMLLGAQQVHAGDCFEDAAQAYAAQGVSAPLLRAIAAAESGMRADAVNASHLTSTRTRDIGLMQVNTGWLPTLAKFGIDEARLFEPCTNVRVGAWILASAFARQGATWSALGSYNAACTQLRGEACTRARARYAWRVYRRFDHAAQAALTRPAGTAGGPPAPTEPSHKTAAPVAAGLVSVASNEGVVSR